MSQSRRVSKTLTVSASSVTVASSIARASFPGKVENLSVQSGPKTLSVHGGTWVIKVTGKVR